MRKRVINKIKQGVEMVKVKKVVSTAKGELIEHSKPLHLTPRKPYKYIGRQERGRVCSSKYIK